MQKVKRRKLSQQTPFLFPPIIPLSNELYPLLHTEIPHRLKQIRTYNLLKQHSRIHDLTLKKQNTSTGCTGISNFIPVKNYIMCVHEHTLQRHFCKKHFMNAIPVRQTQIKLSRMSVCANEHFTVVPLMTPSTSKPSFQQRICFTNTELSTYFFHVQSVTIKRCGEHPHKRTFLDFDNSPSSRLLSTGDPSKGCLTASRPFPMAPPVPTAS